VSLPLPFAFALPKVPAWRESRVKQDLVFLFVPCPCLLYLPLSLPLPLPFAFLFPFAFCFISSGNECQVNG
jgi:hypothetical protein